MLRDGYTKEEFDAAKISWAQGRQVSRTQDAGLVGTLGLWTHVGRTMQWDADFEAKVASLTIEQVRDAMRKHLDVGKMTFMKGGDFESVSAAGGAQ